MLTKTHIPFPACPALIHHCTSKEYIKNKNTPYYPIFTQDNQEKYNKYLKNKEKNEILHTLAYHELYKIDRYINEGKYENSIDFFAGSSSKKRIWLKNKNEVLQMSYGGYTLQKILYNNSETIYPNNNGDIYEKFKYQIIKRKENS